MEVEETDAVFEVLRFGGFGGFGVAIEVGWIEVIKL